MWISERELGREAERRGEHRPDGLVRLDGRESAVEVELTLKERRRAARIMRELLAVYPAVSYFAAPSPLRLIRELADGLGASRVQVLPLPEAQR